MRLEPARLDHAPAMASAHAQAFDAAWDQATFEELLRGPGAFGFVVLGEDPAGVVLCRAIAGEVEVLTLAVAPWARRQGLAHALMTAALGAAAQAGAVAAFLEVAADNAAAIALYEGLGFRREGVRKGYYTRVPGVPKDALVMRLDLTSQAL